jgi:hypothetical protein
MIRLGEWVSVINAPSGAKVSHELRIVLQGLRGAGGVNSPITMIGSAVKSPPGHFSLRIRPVKCTSPVEWRSEIKSTQISN